MLFVIILLLVHFSPVDARIPHLQEVYEFAAKHSSAVVAPAIHAEMATEQKKQAVSAVLPRLSAVSSTVWREEVDVGPFGEGRQHSAALQLSQTLFRGSSSLYVYRAASHAEKAAKLNVKEKTRLLYERVAGHYYDLLAVLSLGQTLEEQIEITEKRNSLLSERVKIGRSRKTDILSSRSLLAKLKANLMQNQSDLVQALAPLRESCGGKLPNAFQKIEEEESLKAELDEILKVSSPTAIFRELEVLSESNIFLKNRLELLKQKKDELSSSYGSFLPSANLEANYYLDRAGILRDSRWDLFLNFRWEFFSGLNDKSEMKIKAHQYQLQLVQNREFQRNFFADIEALKAAYQKRYLRKAKLKEAYDLGKETYLEFLREYDQGLVSQVDLLGAQDELFQSRKDLILESASLKKIEASLHARAGNFKEQI